jgi:hypothetical protein
MVARLKWSLRICDWIGLTRNCETWGDRSWSHVSVVSHFCTISMRQEWVMLYRGSLSVVLHQHLCECR